MRYGKKDGGQWMEKIVCKAMAKVNLGLDVLRRRQDGYHEVRMIMQSVDLYDVLTFEKTEAAGIVIRTNKKNIPTDQRNLIYKAADLLMRKYSITDGLCVTLEKRIPMAAGMAGGSTDAAAVFVAINELFSLHMTQESMCELAVTIGADVPYCIVGGTVLAEGIGEKLTKLADAPACTLLIAKPSVGVSTKYVYENLHADKLRQHPDIDGMLTAICEDDLDGVAKRLGNVLETVTVKAYPVIEKLKSWMMEHGAVNALMSGSGPTVFGIYKEAQEAQRACEQLRRLDLAQQVETAGLTTRSIMIKEDTV